MKLRVPLTYACIMAAGIAVARADGSAHLTKPELQRMIRTANNQEQYLTLAHYFRAEQRRFEGEAQEERQEWIRRSANVTGVAAKYPRPVDSSKNRYEYFLYEAREMDRQAAHYEGLSASVK